MRRFRLSAPNTRSGFTLIELLVVIAIIAILAAILFPVFAQAREKARTTACLSNCKQIGTATSMYVNDYDETYPGWPGNTVDWNIPRPDGTVYTGKVVWPMAYFPYIKNMQVFTCPSDPNPRASMGSQWGKPIPMSYGTNLRLFRCAQTAHCPAGTALKMAVVDRPADTYWIADIAAGAPIGFESGPVTTCTWGSNPTQTTNGVDRIRFTKDPLVYCSGYPQPGNAANPDASTRHQGGSNVVYADGHAKWERWQNIQWQKTCPAGVNTAGTGCINPQP